MNSDRAVASLEAAERSRGSLAGLLNPSSIALVGASDNPTSFGNVVARNLLADSDFDGSVYLVARHKGTVLGRPTYPSLGELPADVRLDAVLVLVPADEVLGVLEQAAGRGARFAVVFSGGFSEAGAAGKRLEAAMLGFAIETGMRIYGPNSPGLIRFRPRLGLTIQPGFCDDKLPGSVGLVAQSGGMGRGVLQSMQRGLGFSYFFSPGNQVDLEVADFLAFLVDDPSTAVVAAVVEGFKSPGRFVAAADAARAAGKPLVILKLGRTEAGRRAALSHTGSLTGSDRAFDAFCRARSVIRVDDVDELVGVCALLRRSTDGAGLPIGIYGMSGGAGVLAVDALSRQGLAVARLGEETRATIAGFTGSYLSVGNPVDVSGLALSRPDTFAGGLRALASDPSVGPVLVLLNAWYAGHTERFVEAIVEVARASDKLIVPVWMSESAESPLAALDAAGLHPFSSVTAAARALALVARYQADPRSAPEGRGPQSAAARAHIAAVLGSTTASRLLEATAKRILAGAGLPVTREEVASSASRAVEIAGRIGYPVVVKVLSPQAVHRERQGLVRLDLRGPAEVEAAYLDLHERFVVENRPEDWEGALVGEMVGPGVDAFLGVVRDPDWGPLFAIGPGGAQIEEADEVALVALPATPAQIRAAIAQTRLGRLLARGPHGRPMDEEALLEAADRLMSLALAFPELVAVDVNPIRVRERGSGAIALDAFIERVASAAAAGPEVCARDMHDDTR